MAIPLPSSKLVKSQVLIREFFFNDGHQDCRLIVSLRYDDDCGNGHNSFAITGALYGKNRAGNYKDELAFGCIHEEIVKQDPSLKPYLKWHLCSADGPMHYVANTTYHAGNRDYNGRLKGEEAHFETHLFFNDVPLPVSGYKEKFIEFIQQSNVADLVIKKIEHEKDYSFSFAPKYSFNDFATQWYQCPFDNMKEAEMFLHALRTCKAEYRKECVGWGQGKERDLTAARDCAVWPEATDAELSVEKNELTEKLLARLPALMVEFKAAIESLGFTY